MSPSPSPTALPTCPSFLFQAATSVAPKLEPGAGGVDSNENLTVVTDRAVTDGSEQPQQRRGNPAITAKDKIKYREKGKDEGEDKYKEKDGADDADANDDKDGNDDSSKHSATTAGGGATVGGTTALSSHSREHEEERGINIKVKIEGKGGNGGRSRGQEQGNASGAVAVGEVQRGISAGRGNSAEQRRAGRENAVPAEAELLDQARSAAEYLLYQLCMAAPAAFADSLEEEATRYRAIILYDCGFFT